MSKIIYLSHLAATLASNRHARKEQAEEQTILGSKNYYEAKRQRKRLNRDGACVNIRKSWKAATVRWHLSNIIW